MTTQQEAMLLHCPNISTDIFLFMLGETKFIYFKACLSTFGITKSRLERIQKNLTPTGMAPLDRRGKRQNRPLKASERY
ncbi:hypothetical protein PoB_000849800 [Plakobranchus ocellatus]|uniref:Uncharacterized protein n=1 Tax=Plakobranchus ocellatus TaxID=259542 RepID=A0AAV3YHJ5_9GAST|nr:hypothetical protein PoB_000849800 [Plakobranchus ocellatus]